MNVGTDDLYYLFGVCLGYILCWFDMKGNFIRGVKAENARVMGIIDEIEESESDPRVEELKEKVTS